MPCQITGRRIRSDAFVVLDALSEVIGDDRLALGLPLHVSARTAACDPGLLDAFGVVAHEGSVDDILAGSAAEFAGVILEIQCHASRMYAKI